VIRRTRLRRGEPLKRGGPIKARNAKRRQSEFARCYGSKERVAWVKAQPCIVCVARGSMNVGPSDNAHTSTGGMGRKADYRFIVPMCRTHHREFDQHVGAFGDLLVRMWICGQSARVEEHWQAHQLSLS